MADRASVHPAKAPGEAGLVMVVDDQPEVARTFARILTRAGFRVEVYHDGFSAARRLAEAQFDAVVSDIAMPGLDGIALLREIRMQDLDVPVVLITGAPSVSSAISAVENGALRYLPKPVASDVLIETMAHAVKLGELGRVRRLMLEATGLLCGHLSDKASLEAHFDKAIEELFMLYQPIVSWSTRSVYAYEAFVRSQEVTLSTPAALFDAADRLGRVTELSAAIRGMCSLPLPQAPASALLCVNVDTRDLLDEEMFSDSGLLAQYAGRVILEVTERARLEQVPDLQQRITRLRHLGYRVALDDVGVGYAGLSSFVMLDPDIIKLDRALVHDLDESQTKRRLVHSMAQLCAELGIQVVAEGVETVAERDTLVGLGVDLLQGFVFSQPAPPFAEPCLTADALPGHAGN
jgi:EAL domain-containing protein (putative c-di-GMP-specific phosphodiesterase class I)/FixJ family two-component response regulator